MRKVNNQNQKKKEHYFSPRGLPKSESIPYIPDVAGLMREISPSRIKGIKPDELHKLIIHVYGWNEWTEDPWGSLNDFYTWFNKAKKDDTLAVWAVNNTFGGRVYLTYNILHNLGLLDYSKMQPGELMQRLGTGMENFLWVKGYSGWQEFNYPTEPFPIAFVNERVIKFYMGVTFLGYRYIVTSIYLATFILNILNESLAKCPDLKVILDYAINDNKHLHNIYQKLAPKNYPFPDENKSWLEFGKAIKIPLRRVIYKTNKGRLLDDFQDTFSIAQEGLLRGRNYWETRPFKAVIAALQDKLRPSILTIAKRDVIDAIRHQVSVGEPSRKEIFESQIDAFRESRAKAKGKSEIDQPFLDTLEGQDLEERGWEVEEQEAELVQLFNKAELTRMKRMVAMLRKEDIDYASIAAKMSSSLRKNISEESVRKHFSNARKKLMKVMKQ